MELESVEFESVELESVGFESVEFESVEFESVESPFAAEEDEEVEVLEGTTAGPWPMWWSEAKELLRAVELAFTLSSRGTTRRTKSPFSACSWYC